MRYASVIYPWRVRQIHPAASQPGSVSAAFRKVGLRQLTGRARASYEQYPGEKELLLIEGDHNGARPHTCKNRISTFFQETLLNGTIGRRPCN